MEETEQMVWTVIEYVTVVALIAGPTLAVWISKTMDFRRAKEERRMDVFRTLMRTRRSRLGTDHVAALNLVEIEFRENENVLNAWRGYFKNLGSEQARREDEKILEDQTSDEKQLRYERYHARIAKERERLLATLLHAMAQSLKYDIEALEIFEGGYSPQGWADMELQNDAIRRYVVGLYLGNRALPVSIVAESDGRTADTH